ncbi:MAG: hypothetical protein EGQ68_01470 [Faecalibacterium sp.]|nr:hypothetical protein [Faecalibacterium sp.]
MHQFQRDAYGRAYIPGSSLKGALRTARLVHLLLHETPAPGKKRTLEAFEVNHDYVFPEGSYANKLRSGAAALFKSRCSCSMHPCRHSYRVGPAG